LLFLVVDWRGIRWFFRFQAILFESKEDKRTKERQISWPISRTRRGAIFAQQHMRLEFEAMIADKIDRLLSGSRLVTREDFEVVKAMAEKARMKNEALRAEIESLKTR
jgi:BMFP domain-containing protein YqiC